MGAFLALFAVWVLLADDPLGGEPVVTVALQRTANPSASEHSALPAPPGKDASNGQAGANVGHDALSGSPAQVASKTASPPPNSKIVTIIDGSSGKRQEVVIPAGPAPKAPANAGTAAADQRLLEPTRYGPIPKIGATGARPVDVYRRPVPPVQGSAERPRIAIVMVGLGIGASTTVNALSRLPPAVSLAFLPYGTELQGLIAQARERGHEVLLQASMEPFDYPDNDPGPRTLLTALERDQNIDRLHWLMSRFQGYVGVANYMGAKFTASEKDLTPILSEIGKRGLMYFDDGSSAHSEAARIAAADSTPFAKAEVTIDAVPSPTEIDRALARLESIARGHGVGVGVAAALPVNVDRIVRWARDLDARGIDLVPITAVALNPKSS